MCSNEYMIVNCNSLFLSDLYGSTGHPLTLNRTLIIGKNGELVKRLLRLLTYFVRCCHLQNYNDTLATPTYHDSDIGK